VTERIRPLTVSPVIGDLRAAFTALGYDQPKPAAAELQTLRGHVYAAVDEMKAAGVLPEHVVISVKRLALDSGIHWTDDEMFGQVIDWCLEHYFRAPFKH
jgi:hypothetical protein